ncbi:thioesterase II family protein [Streptomyces cuspidosporus]|uniref:thioesterase II family protein n=1 Tax=Streptomyces cuspidosporus TaxID=66882 RepID=UPI0031FC8386
MRGPVNTGATSAMFRELRTRPGETRARAARPDVTCFLIHHAGGSAAAFADFAEFFPPSWRLCAVELPGRGLSAGDPPCRSAAEAVRALAPALLDGEIRPWAVFGHSMGGLVAYELAREMERCGTPPIWLGVSGLPAPRLVSDRFTERRDLWPQERLVAFMRGLGGTPEELLESPDVVEYMVEVLRGDLAIVDTYTYADGPPLGMPLSVHSGHQDPLATGDTLEGWRAQSTARVEFHSWPGGHFQLYDRPGPFALRMAEDIDRALAEDRDPAGRKA